MPPKGTHSRTFNPIASNSNISSTAMPCPSRVRKQPFQTLQYSKNTRPCVFWITRDHGINPLEQVVHSMHDKRLRKFSGLWRLQYYFALANALESYSAHLSNRMAMPWQPPRRAQHCEGDFCAGVQLARLEHSAFLYVTGPCPRVKRYMPLRG